MVLNVIICIVCVRQRRHFKFLNTFIKFSFSQYIVSDISMESNREVAIVVGQELAAIGDQFMVDKKGG